MSSMPIVEQRTVAHADGTGRARLLRRAITSAWSARSGCREPGPSANLPADRRAHGQDAAQVRPQNEVREPMSRREGPRSNGTMRCPPRAHADWVACQSMRSRPRVAVYDQGSAPLSWEGLRQSPERQPDHAGPARCEGRAAEVLRQFDMATTTSSASTGSPAARTKPLRREPSTGCRPDPAAPAAPDTSRGSRRSRSLLRKRAAGGWKGTGRAALWRAGVNRRSESDRASP